MRRGRAAFPCNKSYDQGRGDKPQQKAESGLKHIAKAAAQGENGQTYQAQKHIHTLAGRTPIGPQQAPGHGRKEELQGDGGVAQGNFNKRAHGGQGRQKGCPGPAFSFFGSYL